MCSCHITKRDTLSNDQIPGCKNQTTTSSSFLLSFPTMTTMSLDQVCPSIRAQQVDSRDCGQSFFSEGRGDIQET